MGTGEVDEEVVDPASMPMAAMGGTNRRKEDRMAGVSARITTAVIERIWGLHSSILITCYKYKSVVKTCCHNAESLRRTTLYLVGTMEFNQYTTAYNDGQDGVV
jgi:hypothetical protein